MNDKVPGAKTPHGQRRPEFVRHPDLSRDPPAVSELNSVRGQPGAKLWRKAREGKL
jgi:hypothetical protein